MNDSARDFTLNGMQFKLGKIDAFRQFHIVRRIGPLLAELVDSLRTIGKVDADKMSEQEKLEHFSKLAAPVMQGLAKLSDADADYVLLRLLSSVEVHQEKFNSWAKVATDQAIAMQDLDLPILLQVAGRALMYNLSGFFALLPRQ